MNVGYDKCGNSDKHNLATQMTGDQTNESLTLKVSSLNDVIDVNVNTNLYILFQLSRPGLEMREEYGTVRARRDDPGPLSAFCSAHREKGDGDLPCTYRMYQTVLSMDPHVVLYSFSRLEIRRSQARPSQCLTSHDVTNTAEHVVFNIAINVYVVATVSYNLRCVPSTALSHCNEYNDNDGWIINTNVNVLLQMSRSDMMISGECGTVWAYPDDPGSLTTQRVKGDGAIYCEYGISETTPSGDRYTVMHSLCRVDMRNIRNWPCQYLELCDSDIIAKCILYVENVVGYYLHEYFRKTMWGQPPNTFRSPTYKYSVTRTMYYSLRRVTPTPSHPIVQSMDHDVTYDIVAAVTDRPYERRLEYMIVCIICKILRTTEGLCNINMLLLIFSIPFQYQLFYNVMIWCCYSTSGCLPVCHEQRLLHDLTGHTNCRNANSCIQYRNHMQPNYGSQYSNGNSSTYGTRTNNCDAWNGRGYRNRASLIMLRPLLRVRICKCYRLVNIIVLSKMSEATYLKTRIRNFYGADIYIQILTDYCVYTYLVLIWQCHIEAFVCNDSIRSEENTYSLFHPCKVQPMI